MLRLSAFDYLALVDRLGLFGPAPPAPPAPELCTAVWRAYLALYAAHAGSVQDIDIIATEDGFAVYRDPLMGEETWTWALTGPLSHPILPWRAAQIIAAAPRLADALAAADIAAGDLVTDSFDMLSPASAEEARHFVWVNSPVATFGPTFDLYVENLAAPRRKQARRLLRHYDDDPAFQFDFSDRPPDSREFDFIAGNTHRRWGADEAPFALAQTLWVMATAQAMPHAARFMRVYHSGRLVFFNSYVIRRGVMTSQATCRSEADMFSGLGVLMDFKVIQLLTGNGAITALDPTCMTGIVDPGSILVAKREVVNTESRKPLLVLGNARVPGAPRLENGAWQLPDELLMVGRGL